MDLSVLTPSYNYAQFIGAAIESVDASVAVEHVIWDGGSTDDTPQLLRGYGQRITWESGPDAGQSDALNRALSMSTGRYVAWLNSDDFYLPGALDRCVSFLDENPDVAAVQGDTALVDIDGHLISVLFGYRVPYAVLASRGCVIASTSTVFRRSALEAAPWDKRLRYIMDWDLYLTLLEGGKRIAYLPELIGGMRIHEGQVTAGRRGRNTPEHRYVREKHGLGWRGAAPIRLAADVAHKLLKMRDARAFGAHQVMDPSIRLLDEEGRVDAYQVARLRRQVYGPSAHTLSSGG